LGQQSPLTIQAKGRFVSVDQIGDVILKVNQGNMVRLRDVARIEVGPRQAATFNTLDGKPVAVLVVFGLPDTLPREVPTGVQERLSMLGKHCPAGVELVTPFDISVNLDGRDRKAASSLLLDVDFPAATTPERRDKVLAQASVLLREME